VEKKMEKQAESVENYLETILMLGYDGAVVRSVDIANELGYSKPSISVAMKNLRANGYIKIESGGHIILTESGREIAQRIYNRHKLISDLLIFLGVDNETAVKDACKMEHGMSENSFMALQKHLDELKQKMYMNRKGDEENIP
jgi:Mn-dependent DtxR family transcriptional regulator